MNNHLNKQQKTHHYMLFMEFGGKVFSYIYYSFFLLFEKSLEKSMKSMKKVERTGTRPGLSTIAETCETCGI